MPTPREQLSGDDFNVGKSRIYNFIYFVVALAIGAGAFMAVRLFASYRRRKAQSESMPLMLVPKPVNAPLITNEFPLQTNHDAPRPQPAGGNSNHSGESVAVRMPKPPDGTLQLLPGRFEIASGNDRMKEIRFVKTPGPAVVTFGRYAGEGHSHVQVDSPTVSRMHARMRFEGGRWHIANLSATNPVVLNGEPLPADGNEQVLNDKDQVEMGEVVFRFRAR